ncbi:MAG: TOBE domain-containing protein [Candidatus Kapabacteria bacterium]|nr:TOBE domain-containing protein [Candidatus Kapabacteria bacterium]
MNLIPYNGRTLGVRPERLQVQPSSGAVELSVLITAVEFIGHEWLIHGTVDDTIIIMRSHEQGAHRVGETASWFVPVEYARWF